MKKKILDYIMYSDTIGPVFWRLWFWWGIRQARKRRIENEKWLAEQPSLTLDEYWEQRSKEK